MFQKQEKAMNHISVYWVNDESFPYMFNLLNKTVFPNKGEHWIMISSHVFLAFEKNQQSIAENNQMKDFQGHIHNL